MDLSTAPNAPMKTKRSTPIATDAVLESLRRRGKSQDPYQVTYS